MCGTSGFAGAMNGGVIQVRSGPQAVTADAAAVGQLLGIVTLHGGDWTAGDPTNGLVVDAPAGGGVAKPSGAIWQFKGLAEGTIGSWRYVGNAPDDGLASQVLPRMDGAAAVGGGDAKFSSLSVKVGQIITLDVFSFFIPAQ